MLLGAMALIGCGSSKPQAIVDASTIVPEVVQEEKAPNPEGLRHFMDGQLLMNQGDFAMAIIEFQQALNGSKCGCYPHSNCGVLLEFGETRIIRKTLNHGSKS